MSCTSCSTNKTPGGCKSNGSCGTGGCGKLNVFDWLANMEAPAGVKPFNLVEVRFKNGRKDFYSNETGGELFQGDIVATEASPGHDIGVVSLSGELVRMQMKKKNISFDHAEIKKVYRKAKQTDIDKWQMAKDLEIPTMYKARTLALKLKLQMKISDVEYQGDKTKAIFYYTADERVDFRELIKIMADEFKIRIEMKQIGARQEASRLGGIGSCGRELCCSTWLTDFRSVSTSAARYQQLSLNPLKLAGQCGKLKCCLNYELDSYLDALKDIPDSNTKLETVKGRAFHQKTDIFKRVMWFSYFDDPGNFIPLSVERVNEIIELNKKGEKPDDISIKKETPKIKLPDFENVVGQDSLTRFDNTKKKKKKKKKKSQGNQSNVSAEQKGSIEKPINTSTNSQTKEDSKPITKDVNTPNNQQRKPHRNNNRNRNNNNRPTKPSNE
ncbi:MAG TPA: regulatory iron-sulfur-containing complex subunit RicT [Bacteroidia bacterium]|nr:regulatory iron-sulfur-containing complex subunit RicT [Bacteroidia bacterium]